MPDSQKKQDKCKKRRKLSPWRRLVLWGSLAMAAFVALPVIVAEGTTCVLSAGRCFDTPEECSGDAVGLVLGCSKWLAKGYRNYFFLGRMEAAAALWKSGKVTHLIVSGDNSSRYYNEPKDMKETLVELGVPADRIVCDYAGVRTYDSVVRAREIFEAGKLIIVSQSEHVHRAVAIASYLGIEAEGLNAPLNVTLAHRLKQSLRERGARVAMVLDFLVDREPKHLGEKEPITGKKHK